MMIVSDPVAGKVLATPAIGAGPGRRGLRRRLCFQREWPRREYHDGRETAPGKWEPVATIATQNSARTIGADQKAHKLYLPAAEFGPAPPRPPGVDDPADRWRFPTASVSSSSAGSGGTVKRAGWEPAPR